jgi:hypothetical protein
MLEEVPELTVPEPVVPALEVPEVPGLAVVGFGLLVEPEFTEPLLLTPGPELAAEDVPPVEPLLLPVPPDWA